MMNPLKPVEQFFGKKTYKPTLVLAGIVVITWPVELVQVQFFYFLALVCLSSIIIWKAGDHFSPAAEYVEARHNLPQSVKAAVIDAIASSFPELAVAVIAVLVLGRFEVGVATIAGSALYNVLIIPAAAGLVAATPLVVSREVVWRDSFFYLGVLIILIALVLLENQWSIGIAGIFFFTYLAYIYLLQRHYKSHQKKTAAEDSAEADEPKEMTLNSEKAAWFWIVSMMLLMGGASHVLVEASIGLGALLGIDAVVMAFIVIAAGTSAPDTALSVLSAQRGNYDAAVSNVFGSNIFDICICLSVPITMMFFGGAPYTLMEMPHMELLWSLLGATIVAIVLFYTNNRTLTKPKSILMLVLYFAIFFYALTLA